MKRKILLVFPTNRQVEYVLDHYSNFYYYIVIHEDCIIDHTNIQIVTDENESDMTDCIDVLPCHEEGIYWLKCHWKEGWRLPFSSNLFHILRKDCFKKYLSRNNVKNTLFWNEKEHIDSFPIVIKPVIGFGSIGVKKVNNLSELDSILSCDKFYDYLNPIEQYRKKYFPEDENALIYEEFIDGTFYRVPYVLIDGAIKAIYPVKGKKTTVKNNSDFHWTEFELGQIDNNVIIAMKEILEKIAIVLKMNTGVFVAEFLVDMNNEIFLLEMSPRQTSERICRMIYYHSGIDLELLAVDLFLSGKMSTFPKQKRNNVQMQIFRKEISYSGDYYLLDIIEETSVFGDKIVTVYSEKVGR